MCKLCCEDLSKMAEAEELEQGASGLEIYGKPRYANDGDGYFDDMTNTYPIVYCPFCGAKIEEV
jgi:hypothetical protein